MSQKTMRFIIREQEYERLLAAGRLSYRSGAVETWRLTQAVAGYKVMRVDLDGRDAGLAYSTLYHLVLDPDGRLERLKLRVLSTEDSTSVDVLADDGLLSVSRVLSDGVLHDEFEKPRGFGLLIPCIVGMALFASQSGGEHRLSALSLDAGRRFAPSLTTLEINGLNEESIAVTGQRVPARPYLISKEESQYTIWLDNYGLPVRADDNEGTLAIEDRYVRHY